VFVPEVFTGNTIEIGRLGCSAHRYTGCGRKKVILISVILVILINVNKLIAMKEINAL